MGLWILILALDGGVCRFRFVDFSRLPMKTWNRSFFQVVYVLSFDYVLVPTSVASGRLWYCIREFIIILVSLVLPREWSYESQSA
ncbi:hypothetical protein F5B20DRAFT_522266 [Whalleya microplaca]|nr:hypothetical protein F5B20DRAFT_522266 [Whalleya microplaca]